MTNLLKLNYFFLATWLLLINSALTHAADLTFTPASPVVEVGQEITLTVSGTSGQITWSAQKGWIVGVGNQVTYKAPDQAMFDVVTVLDAAGNIGTVKIQVFAKSNISQENAVWEVFTNRSSIQALLLSDDGKTLWVGTNGGLEKRDAQTGDIQQVFINTDGLPDNSVMALLSDSQGGIWVGTDNGLAHYTQGLWQVFKESNSGLPDNHISALLSDGSGGLWIGTKTAQIVHREITAQWKEFEADLGFFNDNYIRTMLLDDHGELWLGTDYDGLVHYNTTTGQKEVFHPHNSELPGSFVTALQLDNSSGIWIGTEDTGLAHRSALGQWTIFNPDNSKLPSRSVQTLLLDGRNGLWVGTAEGLVYRDVDGQWEVFNPDNSGLSGNFITTLLEDGRGGLWIGTNNGLAYRDSVGQWQVFKNSNELPDNSVSTLLLDNHGGLWMGTFNGGIAHLDVTGQWEVFNTANSGLPDNIVLSLHLDNSNGLWVGTKEGGLAYRDSIGQWNVFDTSNSELPDNTVNALLLNDRDGLWIGTYNGLVHRKVTGQWEVFYPYKLGVSTNSVFSLLSDGKGGLWVGTGYGGLMHRDTTEQWEIFNPDDSKLPPSQIVAMLLDDHEGLWIGTRYGLLYHDTAGQWEVLDTKNSNLPHDWVESLQWDGSGGIWVGTDGGLAHRDIMGQWKTFTTEHSDLPDNLIYALLSDNKGGLWIGNNGGGLAHLTFPEKQTGNRAAILIASGGNDSTNSLWETTESIITYLYKMLATRKFVNEEIYYLSPQGRADFNGDGRDDYIVDAPRPERPLVLDDIRQAFAWAKGRGKLDQPLYVFFMDHGGTEKLQLSKLDYMEATDLKAILDDYQTTTGNQLVLVIEACYSGSFLPVLRAPNRAILTSASANETANFVDKQGFTRFFTKYLLSGANFLEAFQLAQRDQNKMLGKFAQRTVTASTEETAKTTQLPQLDDNGDGVYDLSQDGQWLKQLKINGDLQMADSTLTVESLTSSTTLPVGQSLNLQAKAGTVSGQVKQVWAVIRPPRMNRVIDTNGTPILAFPRQELIKTPEKDIYQTTWDNAVYNGEYEITFYAEDKQGNITGNETSIIITVTGGVEPPPQATVTFQVEKDRYQRGDTVKVTVKEDLGYGYDLYIGIQLPDGQILTMKDLNQFAPLNPPAKWWSGRLRPQSASLNLLDLPVPQDLPVGQYCLYGVLSPEGNDVFEARDKGLWVMSSQCFEIR